MSSRTDTKRLLDEIHRRIWALDWVSENMLSWKESAVQIRQLERARRALADIVDLVESGDLEVHDMRLLEAETS